jgi:hypothetical protein
LITIANNTKEKLSAPEISAPSNLNVPPVADSAFSQDNELFEETPTTSEKVSINSEIL